MVGSRELWGSRGGGGQWDRVKGWWGQGVVEWVCGGQGAGGDQGICGWGVQGWWGLGVMGVKGVGI